MAGEADLVVSGTGFTSVDIWTLKVDHNIDKPVKDYQIPDNVSNIDTRGTGWRTYLLDLGKVKEVISVQGYLVDEGSSAGYVKKQNMILLSGNCRAVTLTWGTGSRKQTLTGAITKLQVTELPGIIGEEQASGYESEKYYTVQFSLIVGIDKRSS